MRREKWAGQAGSVLSGYQSGSWQEQKTHSAVYVGITAALVKDLFSEVWAGLRELRRDVEAPVN